MVHIGGVNARMHVVTFSSIVETGMPAHRKKAEYAHFFPIGAERVTALH